MLVVLFTWIIMAFVFVVIGIGINSAIKKIAKYEKNIFYDMVWWGIIFSTVYAQFFSLFYKVGAAAVGIIVLIAIICLIACKSEYIVIWKCITQDIKNDPKKVILWGIIGCIIIFCGLIKTLHEPQHSDTYIYHAQSIRWLEEYGIVKGLGNLHNRFAYNSSFMSLQALFSFAWCLDRSQHTVNGFLWIFMMSYAVMTLKCIKQKKMFLSDVFRVLTVMYLVNEEVISKLSSPHTDQMTMVLVVYIIARWLELLEEGEKDYFSYGCLCLMGVFAVSSKLSAALILILVLKPAIELIREKRWLTIGGFIGSGFFIILPFLIRNIIISGYLVYPYAGIDFFNFDWKMSPAAVIYDNHEIMAWGRGLKDVNRYAEPFSSWFPVWIEEASTFNVFLMCINIILLVLSLIVLGVYLKKKKYNDILVLVCFIALFLGWLFTAPLLRYGLIYLYVVPLYYLGVLLLKLDNMLKGKIPWKYVYVLAIVGVSFLTVKSVISDTSWCIEYYTKYPMDYRKNFEMKSVQWEGMELYIPVSGDQTSYEIFPAIPYEARLEIIELRGEDFKDGFKIKAEYKDKQIGPYGNEISIVP